MRTLLDDIFPLPPIRHFATLIAPNSPFERTMPTPTEKILLCSRESIALWRSLQRFEEIIQKCLAHAPKLPLEIKEEVASTLLSMAQLQPSNSLWYEDRKSV